MSLVFGGAGTLDIAFRRPSDDAFIGGLGMNPEPERAQSLVLIEVLNTLQFPHAKGLSQTQEQILQNVKSHYKAIARLLDAMAKGDPNPFPQIDSEENARLNAWGHFYDAFYRLLFVGHPYLEICLSEAGVRTPPPRVWMRLVLQDEANFFVSQAFDDWTLSPQMRRKQLNKIERDFIKMPKSDRTGSGKIKHNNAADKFSSLLSEKEIYLEKRWTLSLLFTEIATNLKCFRPEGDPNLEEALETVERRHKKLSQLSKQLLYSSSSKGVGVIGGILHQSGPGGIWKPC